MSAEPRIITQNHSWNKTALRTIPEIHILEDTQASTKARLMVSISPAALLKGTHNQDTLEMVLT